MDIFRVFDRCVALSLRPFVVCFYTTPSIPLESAGPSSSESLSHQTVLMQNHGAAFSRSLNYVDNLKFGLDAVMVSAV